MLCVTFDETWTTFTHQGPKNIRKSGLHTVNLLRRTRRLSYRWKWCDLHGLPGEGQKDYKVLLCRIIGQIRCRIAQKAVSPTMTIHRLTLTPLPRPLVELGHRILHI